MVIPEVVVEKANKQGIWRGKKITEYELIH